MANRVLLPRALASDGSIVPGALAYFYTEGTTTPLTVYSDEALSAAVTAPLVADSAGNFAATYTAGGLKVDIRDPDTATSLPGYPSDNWHVTSTDETGASAITFTPITGNSATNVQTAIANLTALWNAVTSFGKTLIASNNASAARTTLGLGSAATTDSTDYATAAQGTLADDALPASDYKVQAWGTFVGTGTPAWSIRNGFSASITDNGTGDYTLTFSSAQANNDYVVILSCTGVGLDNRVIVNVKTDGGGIVTKTTTSFRITAFIGATGTAVDPEEVYVTVLGN